MQCVVKHCDKKKTKMKWVQSIWNCLGMSKYSANESKVDYGQSE